MNVFPISKARKRLPELLERAFYQNERIQIERNKKPMAWIVGEPFMRAVYSLMRGNPGLAETLEIMMDDELMEAIEQGTREVAQGKTIPIEEALKD
jgi:hypothetical protein